VPNHCFAAGSYSNLMGPLWETMRTTYGGPTVSRLGAANQEAQQREWCVAGGGTGHTVCDAPYWG
jgi:hypothetical protein